MRNFLLHLSLTCFGAVHAGDPSGNTDWRQWRGPLRTGEAPNANPPVEWNEETNVRWKTRLPGLGHSSPIVVGNHIFITTAVPYGPKLPPVPVVAPGAHDNLDITRKHRFMVLCVNRSDGSIRWKTVVNDKLPHEGGHDTGSLASASPISDGTRVYASFGSHGIFALNFDGEILWRRDPGELMSKHAHGEGASPALHDGVLVVNFDQEKQSFIEAINVDTGETIWRKDRDEVTSWASPLIVHETGRAQVVVAGTDRIRAYDLHNGDVIWQCGGLSANVVATPVVSDGILVAASSYDTRAMLAIDLKNAEGDITGTDRIRWTTTQRTPYVPSMLIVDRSVYFLRHYQNILSRRDLYTGAEDGGPFRMAGLRNIYSSPVAAAGRIYLTDLDGRTMVFQHGDDPKFLALNQLDDSFAATAALTGDDLILRGRDFLYCLSDLSESETP